MRNDMHFVLDFFFGPVTHKQSTVYLPTECRVNKHHDAAMARSPELSRVYATWRSSVSTTETSIGVTRGETMDVCTMFCPYIYRKNISDQGVGGDTG